MSHKTVKVAEAVLQSPEKYPEIILTQAKSFVDWNTNHRLKIKHLWLNRDLRKVYRDTFNQQDPKTPYSTRALKASIAIKAKCITKEKIEAFYSAKSALAQTHRELGISLSSLRFYACLETLDCMDFALMTKYLACVNHQRSDNTVEYVSFLHLAGAPFVAEILAWRLTRVVQAS